MTSPFAACPFCGHTNTTIKIHLARNIGEFDRVYLECKTCLASGPAHLVEAVVHRTQDQLNAAIGHVTRLWNTRAVPVLRK